MKKYFYRYIFLCLVFSLHQMAIGQNNNKQKRISRKNDKLRLDNACKVVKTNRNNYTTLSLNTGIMNYFGDLTPTSQYLSTDPIFTRPSLGIAVGKRVGTRYLVKGVLNWGRIQGNDFRSANPGNPNSIARYTRNLSFRNDIVELSGQIVVDLIRGKNNTTRRRLITPYFFTGAGMLYNNPKALGPVGSPYEGQWIELQPLGTEGQGIDGKDTYHRIQPFIPLGAGIRYRVNPQLDIAVEVGYRFIFTDYIDDVSTAYTDPISLKSDLSRIMADRSLEAVSAPSNQARDTEIIPYPIITDTQGPHYRGFGRQGNKRGNRDNDAYLITNLTFTYVIPQTMKLKKKRPLY